MRWAVAIARPFVGWPFVGWSFLGGLFRPRGSGTRPPHSRHPRTQNARRRHELARIRHFSRAAAAHLGDNGRRGNDHRREKELGDKEIAVARSYQKTLLKLLPFYTVNDKERMRVVDHLIKSKLEEDDWVAEFRAEKEQNEEKNALLIKV